MTVTLFPFFKASKRKKDAAVVPEHLSGKPSYLNNIKKRLAGQVAMSTLLAPDWGTWPPPRGERRFSSGSGDR